MPRLGHSLVLRPCFLPASALKLAEPLYSVLPAGSLASLAPGNTFLSHSDKFSRIMRCILTSQLSVQFSSVTQSCPILCDPVDCSTPGFPVHHQLLEVVQTHVHQVSDAVISSYHPLSSPSPALSVSQHQGLSQWVSSLHQVAKPYTYIFPSFHYFCTHWTIILRLSSVLFISSFLSWFVQNHPKEKFPSRKRKCDEI